ncbi:hypothetical protein D3C86_622700 [compost metagenome]
MAGDGAAAAQGSAIYRRRRWGVQALRVHAGSGAHNGACRTLRRDGARADGGLDQACVGRFVDSRAGKPAARARATCDGGARQRAGLAQQLEQIVAGHGRPLTDEARVGRDEVRRVGPLVHRKKLAVWNAGRVGDGTYDRATGQVQAGDQYRARCADASGAGRRPTKCNVGVSARGPDGQFDALSCQLGGVRHGGFIAVLGTRLRKRGYALAHDRALAARADVVDGRARYMQRAARGNLALVVGDGASQRHRAAGQDLARVRRHRTGLGDRFVDPVVGQ